MSSGYDVNRFESLTAIEPYLCPICFEVVLRAVSAACCRDRFFCSECMTQSLAARPVCPSNPDHPLGMNMLQPRSDIDAKVQALIVNCRHKMEGCLWLGPMHTLKTHTQICSFWVEGDEGDEADGPCPAPLPPPTASETTRGVKAAARAALHSSSKRGPDSDDSEGYADVDAAASPPQLGAVITTVSIDLETFGPPVSSAFPASFPAVTSGAPAIFVGITNQGATCYLNSLLQSLFMTPEFRNAVYRWDPAPDLKAPADTIPYQLARLFSLLQSSGSRAVSSKALTKSFGWEHGEAFEQHDVQELCRVLFDSLESYWKGTPLATVINDLYQGEMKDYITCKACGYESSRRDKYMDVPLVIRGFGKTTAVSSIEEALRNFVETETLDGNNQYDCPQCKGKTDALKGLAFCSFPYILTLQLKRFDFDYTTMRRIKLNDKVTFPHRLDLNAFIDGAGTAPAAVIDPVAADVIDPVAADSTTADPAPSDPAGEPVAGATTTANVSYVYELFSIMIQSGSATGGHYYAYIRSFEDGRWYDFDDSTVTEVADEQIKQAYGGAVASSSAYNYSYSSWYRPSTTYVSSASGYMLFYRRVDPSRNEGFNKDADLPPHIQRLFETERAAESSRAAKEEDDRNNIRVDVYFHDPRTPDQRHEKQLSVLCSAPLSDVLATARAQFALPDDVLLERCRLVRYLPYRDAVQEAFAASEARSLEDLKIHNYASLLLETRAADVEFLDVDPNAMHLKIFVVVGTELQSSRKVTVSQYATLGEFKAALSPVVGAPAHEIEVINVAYTNSKPVRLSPDTGGLKTKFFIYDGDTLYVQVKSDDVQTAARELILLRKNNRRLRRKAAKKTAKATAARGEASWWNSPAQHAVVVTPAMGATEAELEAADAALQSVSDATDTDDSTDDYNDENAAFEVSVAHRVIKTHLNSINLTIVLPGEKEDAVPARVWAVDKTIPLSGLKEKIAEFANLPSSAFRLFSYATRYAKTHTELTKLGLPVADNYLYDKDMVIVKPGHALAAGEERIDLELFAPPYRAATPFAASAAATADGQGANAPVIAAAAVGGVAGDAAAGGDGTVSATPSPLPAAVLKSAPIFTELGPVIITKGLLISDFKRLLVPILAEKAIDIPVDHMRIREKSYKGAGKILLDSMAFSDDVYIHAGKVVCVERLDGPESKLSAQQLVGVVRRWDPSAFTLGAPEEITTSVSATCGDLWAQIAGLAAIPLDNLQVAKVYGGYPDDENSLEIQTEMDWNHREAHASVCIAYWPLYLTDGFCVYYRDKTVPVKALTEAEKTAMAKVEAAKKASVSYSGVSYTPLKEKGVKIRSRRDEVNGEAAPADSAGVSPDAQDNTAVSSESQAGGAAAEYKAPVANE